MKKRLTEESVLLVSVLKWFLLASVIGCLAGGSTAIFIKALNWSTAQASRYPFYFLLLPIGFFFSSLLVMKFAPDAAGHGTEKVIEAVHRRAGRIKALVVPVKLVATIVTLAAGGSAGKEGPCAQIGGGLASLFADLFRFDDDDRRKLVICGISAGFAAVFGTPIAGAIFGIEVLFIGSLLYEVLLPSFVAGIIGYQVSAALGVAYFYEPIRFVPAFTEAFFIKVSLAGIFFGLCSLLLIETMRLGETLFERIRLGKLLKSLLGGVALVGLALLFSTRYLGLGLETIHAALEGAVFPWPAFILKSVFTSLTLSFGGSGGIVTPIFFVGATAGSLFGRLLGLSTATFAAIGMVSLLAGAANTPIAASIMAVELFGPKVAPYAAVACVISFLMTGHRSVYPSQILSVRKSASIQVKVGEEIKGAEPVFQSRKGSWLGTMGRLRGNLAKTVETYRSKKLRSEGKQSE